MLPRDGLIDLGGEPGPAPTDESPPPGDDSAPDGAAADAGGDERGADPQPADFGPRPLVVTVSVAGPGRVASEPDGIACPATCAHAFQGNSVVMLTALPRPGAGFLGWEGDCLSLSPTTLLRGEGPRFCAARFAAAPAARHWAVTLASGEGAVGYAVRQVGERGGYVAVRRQLAADAFDVWLTRLGDDGTPRWSRALGGAGVSGTAALAEAEGGIRISGWTVVSPQAARAWLVELDADGSIRRARGFGDSRREISTAMLPAAGGGVLVAGAGRAVTETSPQPWLAELDRAGDLLWRELYPAPLNSPLVRLAAATDGGYVLSGTHTDLPTGDDALLIRTGADGTVRWSGLYGGDDGDIVYGLAALPAGGFAVTGETKSFGVVAPRIWAMRVDDDGGVLWARTFGAGELETSIGTMIRTTPAGELALAGARAPCVANADGCLWLLVLDRQGDVVLSVEYGGPGDQGALDLWPAADGGYLLAGYTGSLAAGGAYALWVLKVAADGAISADCPAELVTPVAVEAEDLPVTTSAIELEASPLDTPLTDLGTDAEELEASATVDCRE
jgi:hypothetical protein